MTDRKKVKELLKRGWTSEYECEEAIVELMREARKGELNGLLDEADSIHNEPHYDRSRTIKTSVVEHRLDILEQE